MTHPISNRTLFPLVKRLFPIRCFGLGNLNPGRNYIFAMNHLSALDTVVAQAIITRWSKRHLSTFIYHLFYDFPLLNTMLKQWQTIRVKPSSKESIENSLSEGEALLAKGNDVLIFPEGDVKGALLGTLLRAHTGVIRLALKAKKPIIPVGISGSYPAWKFPHTFPKDPLSIFYFKLGQPITLRFGKEFSLAKYYGMNLEAKTEKTRMLLRTLTTELMVKIARLAGLRYQHDLTIISRAKPATKD